MEDAIERTSAKRERSPSFPFIPLRKAVERAQALYDNHRREPARLTAVAPSWGYSPKSSGVLQTAAALKQFNLIEDSGSGDDRKVALTRLGHTIIADARPGAREQGLKEALLSSQIIAEYVPRWVPTRPSDAHCISELHLDRGFTEEAAKSFLRVFDESVAYAQIEDRPASEDVIDAEFSEADGQPRTNILGEIAALSRAVVNAPRPLKDRLQVSFNSQSLAVAATLQTQAEAEQLINTVAAMKTLLPEAGPAIDR